MRRGRATSAIRRKREPGCPYWTPTDIPAYPEAITLKLFVQSRGRAGWRSHTRILGAAVYAVLGLNQGPGPPE